MKGNLFMLFSRWLAAAAVSVSGVNASVADSLNGFTIKMPCGAYQEAGQICLVSSQYDKQTHTFPVTGQQNTTYDVTIRVRGAVEPMTYTGGTLMSAISPHYYVGGRPLDGAYNIYSLTTQNPSQVYFFNAATSVGHTLFALDYTVTIPMNGGSTVVVAANGQNGQEVANFQNVTVSGVAVTQPYKGQFLQFDVLYDKTAILCQRARPQLEPAMGQPLRRACSGEQYFDISGKLLPSFPAGSHNPRLFGNVYIIQRNVTVKGQ